MTLPSSSISIDGSVNCTPASHNDHTRFESPSEVISFLGYNPTHKSSKINNDPYESGNNFPDATTNQDPAQKGKDGIVESNNTRNAHITWAKETNPSLTENFNSRSKTKAKLNLAIIARRLLNRK